jgi:pentatricopeptide repeat protein
LESFEMCNNWARHYCYAGNHETRVNEILRQMKERGVTITTAIIKSVAKRTMKTQ